MRSRYRKLLSVGSALALALASIMEAQAQGLFNTAPSCDAHYANTAAWLNCKGGIAPAWVALKVRCKTLFGTDEVQTNWKKINSFESRPAIARYECRHRALDTSWVWRKY